MTAVVKTEDLGLCPACGLKIPCGIGEKRKSLVTIAVTRLFFETIPNFV